MFKVKLPRRKQGFSKISVLVLSASLVVSMLPSGITGNNTKLSPIGIVEAAMAYAAKDIALNPGRDESELNFTWYTDGQPTTSIIQMAKKSDMINGVFPVAQAKSFIGLATKAATTNYSNKVTATGLEPKTQYVYRVGDGDDANWSSVYDYTTRDASNYTLLFVGDPQIGSSGNVPNDTEGWNKTLKKAVEQFPNISYIMSAGDQVETATNEPQFAAFESPEILRNLPVATTIGNHDTSGANYKYHFNVPNESTEGVTTAGGDYYYTYGDTLFMVLNSNNKTGASHTKFMEDTVKVVPDVKWRIVTFHHDIYGAGPHDVDTDVLGLRRDLVPTFDKLDIDMIFVGHDHSYVRSKLMNGDKVEGPQLKDSQENDVNPTGRTYVTANSASGSKYYDLKNSNTSYIAASRQNKSRMFSTINVTPSTITVDTYEMDNITNESIKIDSYGMVKEPENVKLYTKQAQQKDTTSSIEYYYATNNANAVKNLKTTFKFDSTKIKFNNAELVTPDAGAVFDIDRDNLSDGEVSIRADLATPIRSDAYGEYKDALKLTFDLVDDQKPTKASLQLTKSVLTTQNRHSDTTSIVEESEAEIVVGVEATGVELNKNALNLTVGGKDVLTAAVQPADATNQEVSWKSSDELVATVDENGRVTAVLEGSAKITATTVDGNFTAESDVTVTDTGTIVEAVDVRINEEILDLMIGESGALTATVLPEDTTNQDISWSSSDELVAKVDANGRVTGLNVGTTDITVRTEDGSNKTYTIQVNVKPANISVTGVTLDPAALTFTVGGASRTLFATVNPSNATNKEVTWKSSNVSVATVVYGIVQPVAMGTATITVTTVDGNFINTSTVTVTTASSGSVPSTPTPSTPTPSTPAPSTPAPNKPVPSTPTPSTPVPSTPTKLFTDIPAGYWAATAIQDLISRQILKGTSEGSFEPGRSVTRAEFTAMLVRALNLTEISSARFTDVKTGNWYAEAVSMAVKAGIVQGKSTTVFGANMQITREEMVTMLMRAYEYMNGKASVIRSNTFTDGSQISPWAVDSVKEAVALNLIKGTDTGAFKPRGISTRAEAAQVVYNLLNK
ncbi:hypothetical protein PMSD_22040 [Paenibacillus macquariensis subsp. defensor]|nr:hypothetical protein PMSD_22040 [Paenibacillus macquariensis subsp. defensor]